MTTRLYMFQSAGFVPGVPGIFPGGCQVLVDEDSHQVLASGPLGQPLPVAGSSHGYYVAFTATKPEEAAPSGDQPSAASSTEPDNFNFLKGE